MKNSGEDVRPEGPLLEAERAELWAENRGQRPTATMGFWKGGLLLPTARGFGRES